MTTAPVRIRLAACAAALCLAGPAVAAQFQLGGRDAPRPPAPPFASADRPQLHPPRDTARAYAARKARCEAQPPVTAGERRGCRRR